MSDTNKVECEFGPNKFGDKVLMVRINGGDPMQASAAEDIIFQPGNEVTTRNGEVLLVGHINRHGVRGLGDEQNIDPDVSVLDVVKFRW